jgi:hypothetical protein
MYDRGMFSYEIGKLKMQELVKTCERRQIMDSGQAKLSKPVIQRIVQSLTGMYHAHGGT